MSPPQAKVQTALRECRSLALTGLVVAAVQSCTGRGAAVMPVAGLFTVILALSAALILTTPAVRYRLIDGRTCTSTLYRVARGTISVALLPLAVSLAFMTYSLLRGALAYAPAVGVSALMGLTAFFLGFGLRTLQPDVRSASETRRAGELDTHRSRHRAPGLGVPSAC